MQVAAVAGKGRAVGGAAAAAAARAPLTMYVSPPNEMVTLEDFEVLAFERLKVLKAIEAAKSRGVKMRPLMGVIREAVLAHLGKDTEPEFARRDSVSHHILRLAYCASEENRRWFLAHEALLFRYRAESRSGEEIAEFMAANGLSFTQVSEEEKRGLLSELGQVAAMTAHLDGGGGGGAGGGEEAPAAVSDTQYYKIPFVQALDLIRTRSVYLHRGFAYVPLHRMVSILVGKFRNYLNYNLVYANRFLPEVLRDERLKPMLENLSKSYTGPEYGTNRKSVDRVTAEDVDTLAGSVFPLCMQAMHTSLKDKHKLKHLGRLQYGLFLKGVGLSMEDALQFWQREFTKGMSGEEFTKKYAYNVRYNYGKEGKRADFSPYSCVKIITAPPPAGDEVHGCPFKNWDVASLRSSMMRMKLAPPAIEAVLESVRGRDYQIACRRHFEARFPAGDSGVVGNHPNAYAESANKALKAEAAAASGGGGGGGGGAAGGAAAARGGPAAPPAFSAASAALPAGAPPPPAAEGEGAAAAAAAAASPRREHVAVSYD